MKKDIILSGIRPTGKLHIGNFLGSLKNFIKLQNEFECYFFIADLHSLNESFNAEEKSDQIINLAADYLAAGLNPDKCTIFVQSHLPEHSELAIILSNIIPVSYLFRMTQFKEKSQDRNQDKVNSGLLFYPILMAADILMYKATKIPVGQDQTQHVELARNVARLFNKQFGNTFPEPKPLYTEAPKVMSLIEPAKKMAKTLGDNHCIYIDDEPEIIVKKLAKAPTDIGDAKSQGGKNLLELIKIFCEPEIYNRFVIDGQRKNLKYSELKTILAKAIADYFSNFRQQKKALLKNLRKIKKIIGQGNKKAKKVASETMREVREKIGIDLFEKK